MTKLLVLLVSVSGISCVSIAKERVPASQNSDFTAEYQRLVNSNDKESKDSEAKWHEHKQYLKTIDRANRF